MKKLKRTFAVLMLVCMLTNMALIAPAQATDYADAHTIVLSSTENSDGSYSHTALYNGTAVTEYDYTWHVDPSTVHTDVSNSPAEYYTGTEPGSDAVYIAHDIYYYPELDTSGFTKQSYDGEQEWCYYYTAEGYTSYIFSTLPGSSSLPTSMMHSAEDAYQNAVLHITQPGDYVIEGTWHGQIWVDLENYCDDPFTDPTAKVNLILNGVTIDCSVAAGVVFYNVYECDNTWEDQSSWSYHVDTSAAGAVVTLADGTVNNVTGTNIFRILKTQYKSGSTSVQKKRLKIDGSFYSYQSMAIQGGDQGTGVLNITAGYEGLNSELHLTVNSGNVNIFSQDDGINVNEDNVSVLTINGGTLHILAGLGSEGDGIDSNGFISVNGGTVITMANPGADSGMDSDFGTYVFGGNVVAMGSTMDWVENDTSVVYDQATMNLQFSSSRSAGDAVVITDTSGNGVFAYDPDKDEINGSTVRTYTGAIISSENFEIGQSYYVYIGGEVTGTETKGVYDMTTVTAVSNTYQQSYSSTGSSGGNSKPSMGGSSSGTTGSGTASFALANNVTKFSGVANYSSATSITVTPMEGTGQTCDHVYNAEVTTEATCTTNGLMTYTCTLCGDSYTVNITASGHSYADGTCTVCGAADPDYVSGYYLVGYINGANYGCEEDYANMGDYLFADGKLTATFNTDSYVFLKTEGNTAWYMAQSYCTDTTCTFYNTDTGAAEKMFVPGNVEVTFTLTENADGTLTLSYTTASTGECAHSYTSQITTAATCTTDGVKTYTCSLCGDTYTEAIAATGHSYTAQVTTAATCTTDGVKTYTCSNCGDTYTEAIPATGHSYVGGSCTVCGASDPSYGSTDGSYVLVTDLSEITAGGQFVIAANNSGSYMAMDTTLSNGKASGVSVTVTDNIVTGTDLPVWTVEAVDSGISLSVDGTYLKYNSSSNFTTSTEAYTWTVAAGDSGYTVKASTSTNRAIYYRTNSSVFGPYSSFGGFMGGYITELQFFKYTAADNSCTHSYTEEITAAATCTENGVKTFTCTLCGDSYTESIPATGHSYEAVITAPTCTEAGYTTYTCACGDSYTADEVAATGHSYEAVVTAPTCTEAGYTTYTCACGDSYTADEVAATGHSYEAVVTAPTCTEAGYTTYTCACGDSYTGDEVAATGHSYVNGVCTACGDVEPGDAVTEKVYYLFGYINGANYACEEDYENMGEYKFENGTLTATFTADSYVAVKEADNAAWYMTNGWVGTDVTSVTLYNTNTGITANKLYVPGNVEITFTLTENADGTLTLSYTTADVECAHSYSSQITTAATCTTDGVRTYTCTLCGDSYTESIAATGHTYVDGTCTACGESDGTVTPDPVVTTYYLVGYINGANYGCEEDYENMGDYKFVDGKLTATFTADSYVFLKTEGNAKWYLSEAYCTDTTCTFVEGGTEKLFVPGNVEITFTLTENEDGSVTVSYTTASTEPSVAPTLTLKYPTVSFEDVIVMNVYYTAENLDDVVEMGLITYTSEVTEWNVDNAEAIVPGYTYSSDKQMYMSSTNGIAAKNLGDTLYFAVYAKLSDGTYTYTKLVSYSPETYAYAQLSTGSDDVKPLVVAMLKYGAAAQTFFGHNTDALVDRNLTAEQLALVEDYRSDMMDSVASPSTEKQGSFVANGGITRKYPTVSFEGAFEINYYCVPANTPVDGVTMYYWNQADYDAAEVLTAENATGAIAMTGTGTYQAAVEGIAAKDLDKGIYVAFVYSDGTTTYSSGVLAYSIGTYCVTNVTNAADVADLAAATAVYGYYAKQTFY